MAQIKEIKYDVTCRLQQYESLKVGCTAMVTEGENPGKVMEEVKKFVHASADKAVKEYWDRINKPVAKTPIPPQSNEHPSAGMVNNGTGSPKPASTTTTIKSAASTPTQQAVKPVSEEQELPNF